MPFNFRGKKYAGQKMYMSK